ncbi:N-acetylglucosamine-6-phosphate deacetylase [Ruminococcus albus]|uniref:N-acetylglucosamine-6-phosphate deacetylase n=1 Tax=Ruminococcus albus TaxID=1264 RepID=A0A1H7NIE9_RUMAL|nr:N-acetylglucosamine-6-phosphate deacetylase [Ruminococcus albus]SEL23340.1 N-acetylglucosamine-6-phosphate deacetylase [Ruminococcus albus]
MLIKNGLVFTEKCQFEPLSVLTESGVITGILPADAMIKYGGEVVDASGCYVVPGLTDIHFHGCAGHDFCEATVEAIGQIAEFEYSQGVTTICPATMTLPDEDIDEILRAAGEYSKNPVDDGRAKLIGVHLEGPFISPEKCGAQKKELIQLPSAEKLRAWQSAAGNLIKLVTIAPEVDGAIECIRQLSESIRFSLGHTACGYDSAVEAFGAGADHITHMYNAMQPFNHRAPSLIGAGFDTEGVFAEIICDGVHVSETAVRAAFALFGDDRIILISDSMEATGMPDGEYQLGGQRVSVKGNRAVLSDGTLAGSVTPLADCLRKAVKMGIPLESAIKAATINPCRSIDEDKNYGRISVGKAAHILLLDREDLSLKAVYTQ